MVVPLGLGCAACLFIDAGCSKKDQPPPARSHVLPQQRPERVAPPPLLPPLLLLAALAAGALLGLQLLDVVLGGLVWIGLVWIGSVGWLRPKAASRR